MLAKTVGIIGCGLITQVEHLPNLLGLKDRFEVVGVVDPSAKVRSHITDYRGVPAYATASELFDRAPECVVIATPDAFHVELTLEALERGMNVFVEKPMCYDPSDAQRIAAARDKAGKVVQVGYMKRFDPAFRMLCDLLANQRSELLAVNVEVLDPDYWPFVAHHKVFFGDDVPAALVDENNTKRTQQINAALGFAPDRNGLRGFAGPFCSSLVHDVNLVNGALAALGQSIGEPIGAALHRGDGGAVALARATNTGAPVSLSWTAIPKLAHYSERVSFAIEDAVFELRFPSPYLNHQPTELVERRSTGLALSETLHRPSYDEAFVQEMRAWHDAMEGRAPAVNTVEEAGADMTLLSRFGQLALGGLTEAEGAPLHLVTSR